MSEIVTTDHLRSTESRLDDKIDRVDSKVHDLATEVAKIIRWSVAADQKFNNLEDRFKEIAAMWQKLMQAIVDNFDTFNETLGDIKTETGNVKNAVVDGDKLIKDSVDEVNRTSDQGLRRVSSGMGTIDVLKAMQEAHQSAISIKEAIKEVDTRKKKANEAVELKREEFDKHFELITYDFRERVREIAQHIFEIADHLSLSLDELHVHEPERAEFGKTLEVAQKMITEQRNQMLREGKKRVDLERLSQFQHLRRQLSEFLSNDSAVRLEETATDETKGDLPGFDIPANAVMLRKSEYHTPGQQLLSVYCLDARAESCYSSPHIPNEHNNLAKNIRNACEKLDPASGSELPVEAMTRLTESCGKLSQLGLLREDDAKLICEHLVTHPLNWMEFRA